MSRTMTRRTTSDTASSQATMQSDIESMARKFHTPGSDLDPNAPSFDAKLWVKSIMDLWSSDQSAGSKRKLGVAFSDLSVTGSSGNGPILQSSTGGVVLDMFTKPARRLFGSGRQRNGAMILRDFEGVIEDGELLLVLGPPGSGCSTLLKTIAGETDGLKVASNAKLNFRGIKTKHVRARFRGDVLYNAERDVNLAHLTVSETLTFASRARSPRTPPPGLTRADMEAMSRDVVMAVLGISHTRDTLVGDDYVRGVSGGERKRVSIAEAALTGARLQCWDNSTRGLDSQNAVNFCETLRAQADLLGISAAVAIYQAPQTAYELFDRVTVLYEGRQIYFGPTSAAKAYFEGLGFYCPERQTTPDFLTSMTSPDQRIVIPGFENSAPRTPDEFASRWQDSQLHQDLITELSDYELKHPTDERLAEFKELRRSEQSKGQPAQSPYNISYPAQVSLNLWRGWRRLISEPAYTVASMIFQIVMALILGSLFYNLKDDSSTFYYRGGIVFFSLLLNAFAGQLEVLTVYAERPVVEKQHKYAFYSLSTQAIASYITELPSKTINMFIFNAIVYFMTGLRRDAGSFFFFSLVTYLTTLVMSCLYRTLAYLTRSPAQAMVPSALLSLGLMIYTGFCIPPDYMPSWSSWMYNINPLSYAFEALIVGEFEGRQFACATMVPQGPTYSGLASASRVCSVVGARAGEITVSGDAYIRLTYGHLTENKWRDVAILAGYFAVFFCVYLTSAELSTPPRSRGEVLVFRKGSVPASSLKRHNAEADEESCHGSAVEMVHIETTPDKESAGKLNHGTSVFHWKDLCYDVQVKGQTRRLLDHVDGWVKPGTSTALMGVSGAGKTTLLDVLATRATLGVVSGSTLIDGVATDAAFARRVGYVQQQDLHLETMTVREALQFSAVLRQPRTVPRAEKLRYVDEVIDMLGMRDMAGAVVGAPGTGLNVEQRKRLSIAVELAARPDLLVFLDEPTSGLDAQTAWVVCDLIEKLTRAGQAVLCTIHQPSAMLFQRFDRLLLLAAGGKTVYFGDLGHESTTLIEYLERNGAPKCPPKENPAEWMLDVIQTPSDGSKGIDWSQKWTSSPEYKAVKSELLRLETLSASSAGPASGDGTAPDGEFVASSWTQFCEVTLRTAKHYWRSPTYLWSKILLVGISSLYIGFSFQAQNSLQGLQNQLYAIYMFFVLFGNLNEQIMPTFIPLRALFEVREQPSRMYKWTSFLWSSVLVEAFYNSLMAVLAYLCWYYPVGFVQNTTDANSVERGSQIFLFLLQYMLFTSTFSHFVIAWIETPETAGVLATLLWLLVISFSGVSVRPSDLPSFWTFMWRTSPCTYLIGGIMSSALGGSPVVCRANEVLHLQAPNGTTCAGFLADYVAQHGGTVVEGAAQAGGECGYCPIATTDDYLAGFEIFYSDSWRNFGLLWSYILANVVLTFVFFWFFRIRKGKLLGKK